ncbi:neuron navigator 3 isoform X2 [Clupea harengus]|uniref:Neuron navigator 3 n=1 Tax=Clupea harengus TaxID=7950 RepID=A0A6P8GIQ0_CLUHA|nr:neuron navigator 3 isoform X2 [Clupea harengus]
MPVVGVASKLRQPGVGSKPVHTALPIPNLGRSAGVGVTQGYAPRAPEVRASESPLLSSSCQLSLKGEYQERRTPPATRSRESEESKISKIYTDWANHYLAKSGCPRLIKDLSQDIADGVLLAEIIQIIANEKVEDINGCPRSQSQMIENVDTCLNFLDARGVNVQGLSAEEIRNGNLKSILGLFFILSRYKQQQQHQQQYLQSLVELQQQVTHQATGAAPSSPLKTQDMQSSLTARYASPPSHSGIGASQKKNTRLPGPSRVPTAGSGGKAQGSSNLNRRSQSFNSIDKSKPLQYASGNDRESVRGIALVGSMNGSAGAAAMPSSPSGHQLGSAIPSPTAGKSWRSKSMNLKHSATSSMLSLSPTTSPPPPGASERLRPPAMTGDVASSSSSAAAAKGSASVCAAANAPGNQRSMLDKFRLINPRSASRTSPSVAEMSLQEEDDLSEYGDDPTPMPISRLGGGTAGILGAPMHQTPVSSPPSASVSTAKGSGKSSSNKSLAHPKEKEEKAKSKASKASTPPKEEREPVPAEAGKKSSKIGSLIPKGGKTAAGKKESGAPPASSGIPKPGLKAPHATAKQAQASTAGGGGGPVTGAGGSGAGSGAAPAGVGREGGEKAAKMAKGGQSYYMQRSAGGTGEVRRTSMTSSTSTSALSAGIGGGGGGSGVMGGNGAVQLPQQQQHNHPNTATVAPFMYRTYSENDCTTVAPADPCLSPTKGELVFNKTAKQCLEEISVSSDRRGVGAKGEDPETRRMRTVKNIADLRQNLEDTMSSLRGTQISHSTLETTFDSTVTTEINGRGPPALSSRSSPMAWRLGQSPSPRLQAGDAPSMPSAYAPARAGGGGGGGGGAGGGGAAGRYGGDASRYVYSGPLRRAGAGGGARGTGEAGEKGGAPDGIGPEVDVAGYMSDGDLLAKNTRPDDITSGYLTDGGLHLYSRNVGRAPDLASSREVIQRGLREGDGDSWDDSSSVSSGLSDTLDNICTDDLNTSAYSGITASPRKNKGPQSHGNTHKHVEQVASTWAGAEDLKKVDEELDSSMDPSSKWRTSSSSSSSAPSQSEDGGQKTGLPVSQTGSWRRGMTAQVGITPPRSKGTSGSLKSPGKTDDAKASEKGKASSKSASIERSPSDAGKSSGDEGKKPPSGIGRPPTTGSFGYKKIPGPSGTLITASGATLSSGSSTLGKVPKSSAIGKGAGAGIGSGGGGGRKTSLDGSQHQDDGVLLGCGGSKVPLQYRSLPRPAKSSSGVAAGRGGGHRSSSSSIDSNASAKGAAAGSAGPATIPGAKRREPKVGSGRSSPITVNQTDKEKVAVSDQDGTALSTSPKSSPTSGGQSGLRQPGSKYPDIASPTFRRLFGAKASSKPSSPGTPDSGKCPSALGSPHGTMARQTSLDSPSSGTGSLGSAGGQSGGSSPLYGKVPELGMDSAASSPASGLSLPSNARPWPTTLSTSSAGSRDTLSCQSMTSLHTSSESIDLPLGHHGPKVTRTGSVKSTLSEGMPLDRNTLPKKGLRYPPSSRQTSNEEGKEWLRSHSTGGLQDTGSQSPLSPPDTSCNNVGKYHYSNLLSPTGMSQYNLPGPSMSRSNSIPTQDSFDLYGEGHTLGGSATSLEDRPRGISRSGSFRDSTDEVHGSSLSLVSSTSSLYSAVLSFLDKTEEKAHSEGQTVQNTTQIRKLRRELDASQEKVAALTSQLSANAHLVAAFEGSLANMTCRLQSLTMTAEQKESELAELRETIEALKAQNTDAQTAIQVALNGPDHLRDHRIRRQHSSDSMSSINSAASHSSMGSAKDAEDKKKKKKNWQGNGRRPKVADSIPAQLRSSFKQAFSKKKSSSKLQSSQDDIEEMTDSSLPSSPQLQHANRQGSVPTLRLSPSTTELCECTEAEAEIILQLKNELREKELKLTDIRLEALSSAHHLDQIREAMNRMQNEIELLKAENDRLKSSGNSTPQATPAKSARPPSETSSTSSSSSRQSLGLSLNNLNITDTIMSDILLDDGYEGNLRKEGRSVRIVVTIHSGSNKTKGSQSQEYLIGSIGVSGKTKWDVLDGVIRRLFKEYVFRVDPATSLGLTSESIMCYRMKEVVRGQAMEVPELLPCGYLVGDNNVITVNLKGVKENSIDGLVFDTLIPKPIIQRYLNLLMEHRRIILSGPSGTGKSHLASKLAEYIVTQSGMEVSDTTVASFNVDQKSSKDLRQYLCSLAEQCNSEETDMELPTVVILDNLHHIGSLSDIFNGFLNCKYHKCPYVIGTMNQGVSSSPNLELHHNFRWVLCANHTEPVKGFLGRYLRRKLIETEIGRNMRSNDLIKIIDWIPKTWQHLNSFLEAHSSSDVTIGPRLLLSCPMDVDGSRVWFTDLWNYSLVPYLLEAVREGLQLYGKRAAWEDPSKWVNDTYPWSSTSLQHDCQALLQLRPEDVGYDGYTSSKEGASSKQVSQSDTEGDPLMNMLMRLQEAANYSSAQSCDSDSASHHDDLLDSSLESAL